MQPPIQLDRNLELRDANGTLGYFMPEQVITDLIAERDRLRRERTELQTQIKSLQYRCDFYRASMIELTGSDIVVWDENDINEMNGDHPLLSDVIAELEQLDGMKQG